MAQCGSSTTIADIDVTCDREQHSGFYVHEDSVKGVTWPKIDGAEWTGDAVD